MHKMHKEGLQSQSAEEFTQRRKRRAKRAAREYPQRCLEAELGAAPMATLVIVADLVVGLHTEPIRGLSVLAGLPRKLLLDHEGFVGRLGGSRGWN